MQQLIKCQPISFPCSVSINDTIDTFHAMTSSPEPSTSSPMRLLDYSISLTNNFYLTLTLPIYSPHLGGLSSQHPQSQQPYFPRCARRRATQSLFWLFRRFQHPLVQMDTVHRSPEPRSPTQNHAKQNTAPPALPPRRPYRPPCSQPQSNPCSIS